MPRAWVIHDYSGYQGLSLEKFDEETPGPGEIRMRIEAFALNWGDIDLMRDRYSFSFPEFPARIGMEAAGIVDAIGPDVTGIETGDRYCTLPYFYYNRGASAESLIINARYVTKAPEGFSAVESASIWMQYITAYFPELPIVDMFQTNAVFHPYSLFNYIEDSAMCAKGTTFVYDALASGAIAPRIDRVYPMEGYREAWDYLKAPRRTHGKVVVETGI